ncbi:hypothetical protein NQ317_013382 [Molorchus minor]|uniref:Uncharacterized protein n=1 Tax=Molorchus minor TaxID=1323400 RepID=A0ABQ9IU34_9CUCU|nr:hypothetical protein NQ317_013382 [Molorchus minor]
MLILTYLNSCLNILPGITNQGVPRMKENDLSSNRGNHLLIKLLVKGILSFLMIFQSQLLMDYLAVTQGAQGFFKKYTVNENECLSLLQSYASEYSKAFPMKLGDNFTDLEKLEWHCFWHENT